MRIEESLAIGGALADSSRLLILGTLLAGPRCVEELAMDLALAPSTVSFHLKKLRLAGLVTLKKEQYYSMYALAPEARAITIGDLLGFDRPDSDKLSDRQDAEGAKVLGTFFVEGRLAKMPAQKRKRDAVLEEFAAPFTPGAEYSEPQVDAAISALYADYCLVRRLLVDEGYFRRHSGIYERTDRPALQRLPQRKAPADEATKEGTGEGMGENPTPGGDADTPARRASLRRAYEERSKQAGVFRVVNTANGRVMLGSALDLHAPLNRVKFELDQAICWNAELKRDLETFGRDRFAIEVVETVEPRDDPGFDPAKELEVLERKHLSSLDWTTAYNKDDRIRYP
jgi:DNA-binding transcriptional ArsR family regulator